MIIMEVIISGLDYKYGWGEEGRLELCTRRHVLYHVCVRSNGCTMYYVCPPPGRVSYKHGLDPAAGVCHHWWRSQA